MLRSRITYFFLIILTIIIGLLSRQITGVPLFIGDILWALMVYFIVRFFFIKRSVKFSVMWSLLFCYGIEFSQLYKAPWIDNLRHTLFGRLALGDTFLWGDMLCYTVGVGIGIITETIILKPLS
ncbi:MAG TPA: DUF2809 domain-containing protein [Mucilaginibacter sp.]